MGLLGRIGTVELIIILAIVFLFFGGAIISGVAKKSGERIRDIKKAKEEFEKASRDDTSDGS